MGPLSGVRVIEIASLVPAPFGCMMLADLGADVLQVQRAGGQGAGLTPPAGPMDRGKRTLEVDLKDPGGLTALKDLIDHADVFVEGFRPGVAERLGIGPDTLLDRNPGLVYGRMTGWGQDGPLAPRAGHDINYIAVAGALEPIGRAGERPHAPMNLLGDFAGGGMLLAMGVTSALFERERSGQGQVVDAAMVDGASLYTAFLRGMHAGGMWEGERGTNALDGGAAFYDTYETADGKYVAVGCVEPQFYQLMLAELGIDEEAQDLPFQLDATGWPRLKKVLGAKFKERTRDEWAELFAGSDACVSPVLSPMEAHEHPHNQARDAFVDLDGQMQPAPAPRFSRSAVRSPRPMDDGGRDVTSTLGKWGLAPARVREIVAAGHVS